MCPGVSGWNLPPSEVDSGRFVVTKLTAVVILGALWFLTGTRGLRKVVLDVYWLLPGSLGNRGESGCAMVSDGVHGCPRLTGLMAARKVKPTCARQLFVDVLTDLLIIQTFQLQIKNFVSFFFCCHFLYIVQFCYLISRWLATL